MGSEFRVVFSTLIWVLCLIVGFKCLPFVIGLLVFTLLWFACVFNFGCLYCVFVGVTYLVLSGVCAWCLA